MFFVQKGTLKTVSAIIASLSTFLFSSQLLATAIFISTFGSNGTGPGEFTGPTGIDINTFNNQIIVSDASDRVQIFGPTGIFVSEFGSSGSGDGQFSNAVGVTFNSSNSQIIIADSNNNRIQIFDSTGGYLSQFGTLGTGNGEFSTTGATAINYTTGQLFVTDIGNDRVQVFDAAGNYQSQFGTSGTGPGQFDFPFGITVYNGNITVLDSNNDRVEIFDSLQSFVSEFGEFGTGPGQFDFPDGLAQNSATSQLIVVDSSNNRVQVFDASGNFQYQFGSLGAGPDQFNLPATAGVNPRTGQIVVTDFFNQRVQIFFDPAMWVLPGTSVFTQLPLNQTLTLNNGFNLIVQTTTTLSAGGLITINPGATFNTNTLTLDGGVLSDNANTTLNVPITITNNNGTFISGANNTFTLSGNITGAGVLIKQGPGNLVLTGTDTFAGANINQGTLTSNGSVMGPININPTGTLSGSGTILGNVINNGIISPGTPNTTLTIQGNYTSTSTGVTHIAINSAGQSSHLSVLPGTAMLNGPLTLTVDPGFYTAGTSYTFLNATAVTGTYSSFPSLIGSIKFEVLYTGTTASLLITSTALSNNLSAANKNEIAVANYLDSLPTPPAGSDLAQVIGILTLLPAQELANALESISPGRLSAATVVIENTSAYINYMNSLHLADLRRSTKEQNHEYSSDFLSKTNSNYKTQAITNTLLKNGNTNRNTKNLNFLLEKQHFNSTRQGFASNLERHFSFTFGSDNQLSTIWAHGFGDTSKQRPRHIDPGFNENTAGIVAGMDHLCSRNIILGAGVGHYYSKINLSKNTGKIAVNTDFMTLYGTWYQNSLYIDGAILVGFPRYNTTQHILFPGVDRISSGKHNGTQVAPHIGFGYDFRFQRTNITPFISADYIVVNEKQYLLTGANSLSQNINKKTSAAVFTEIGIRVSQSYHCLGARWTPEAILSYTNKNSNRGLTTAALVAEPGFFTVDNFNGTRYQIAPGASLLIEAENGGFVRMGVYSEFGSGYVGGQLDLRAGFVF